MAATLLWRDLRVASGTQRFEPQQARRFSKFCFCSSSDTAYSGHEHDAPAPRRWPGSQTLLAAAARRLSPPPATNPAVDRNACPENAHHRPRHNLPPVETPCKTRQDTWRINCTREKGRVPGKDPSMTMSATTEGTRDVDGCDDGEAGREWSKGKRSSLELRLPLSIPPKELGSLDYTLSPGHLRCPNTCMHSSQHLSAPSEPTTKGVGRVPPKIGTKWLIFSGNESWRSRRLSTRKPRREGTSHWTVRPSTAPTTGHNRPNPAGPGS